MRPRPVAGSVAVIGAGVAGCACVAQLRLQGFTGPISLWEVGRGPGGGPVPGAHARMQLWRSTMGRRC
ncbi:protein of unknown function [Cyanobium sp. NIES-981]|nr:protein of unknown function [Cyanobium sp. NIES-981]